jgi:uncharacterized protein YdeI (YjbR/CyaY-like superfamily)
MSPSKSQSQSATATAFRTPAHFRKWLERHHASATELILRCYKVHAQDRGITYKQALDEALCFGWIDGLRRSLDADSFTQRFSPRTAKSTWSGVNIKRVGELEAEGRMHRAGIAAFQARTEDNSRRYSYETRPRALAPVYAKKLRANARASAYYSAQPPWYRRTTAFWVMSAKRAETRAKRLEQLIAYSERGKPIPALERSAPRPAVSGRSGS